MNMEDLKEGNMAVILSGETVFHLLNILTDHSFDDAEGSCYNNYDVIGIIDRIKKEMELPRNWK